MKAPNFSLPDQYGKNHSLTDYKGKWIVMYFYPKDDTPGCTKEACGFRDLGTQFTQHDVVILGVSKDTVVSHKKFADKHNLTFPLLSDIDHAVTEKFGAWKPKKFMGREFLGIMRNTYLINPSGEVVKSYIGVDPLTHPAQILQDVESFSRG